MAVDAVVNARLGAIVPQFTLCHETGEHADDGFCPVHRSDACLYQFISLRAAVDVVGALVALARDEGWPPPL